jgi:hypothetical protein
VNDASASLAFELVDLGGHIVSPPLAETPAEG